jgi:hypothetical protein
LLTVSQTSGIIGSSEWTFTDQARCPDYYPKSERNLTVLVDYLFFAMRREKAGIYETGVSRA